MTSDRVRDIQMIQEETDKFNQMLDKLREDLSAVSDAHKRLPSVAGDANRIKELQDQHKVNLFKLL